MSEDYYLVCKDKKILMPLFSMSMGGVGVVSANWVFDFVLASSRHEIKLVHEDSDDMPEDWHEENTEWKFMNAWHKHEDDLP